ncbi:MAG TPA: phage holin family protein [Candidatus Saccharimonadales bacterium]|nr:phage holin family protein [Candidatus Saccharimonadales bacterium]
MKRGPFGRLLLRWFVCSLGLWIAGGILGQRISYDRSLGVVLIAGLILAAVNAVIKPIVVILSLPAILFSLGLFMIVINGLMVLLVSKLYTGLHVTNFGAAMLAGMVIGLVNYLVSTILEER